MLINSGAPSTLVRDVILDLWVSDEVDPEVDDFGPRFLPPEDSARGVADMMISNSSDFAGVSWKLYATSKSWTHARDSALASVYVKCRDAVGNQSDTYVVTIWVGSEPGLNPIFLPHISK